MKNVVGEIDEPAVVAAVAAEDVASALRAALPRMDVDTVVTLAFHVL